MNTAPITGPGTIARWSPALQGWVVQPHNPEWTTEVQESAPVLRVLTDKYEVERYLREAEDAYYDRRAEDSEAQDLLEQGFLPY